MTRAAMIRSLAGRQPKIDPRPDIPDDRPPTEDWVTVAEAARHLGISDEAVRQKAKRRTLRSMKGNDGRLRVLIDRSPTQGRPTEGRPKTTQGVTGEVSALREHVQTLRAELDHERARAEADRLAARADVAEANRRADQATERADRLARVLEQATAEKADLARDCDRLAAELVAERRKPWWHRLWGR